MKKDEVTRRVNEAAAKLGLLPLLQRIIVDLSGGEQQRVALARALAKEADLHLFDEPLSNLDPKLRAQARRDIQMLHREKGKPTIYVTHDQTEALAIGDRIGIIAKGQLQQVGTAQELISKPANTFVAGFIGSPPMSLVHGKIALDKPGTGYEFQCEGFSLSLPRHWAVDHKNNDLILGIHPACIAQVGQVSSFPIGPENTIAAQVEAVQPLIGETIVNLRAGRVAITAAFQEVDETLKPGDIIQVGIDINTLCAFDPETGLALPEEG
jgi:ABC-type sugar transport system ATPase subunit